MEIFITRPNNDKTGYEFKTRAITCVLFLVLNLNLSKELTKKAACNIISKLNKKKQLKRSNFSIAYVFKLLINLQLMPG